MQAGKPTVLVVGGSGYLGQFLVQHLASHFQVSFTYHSTSAPNFGGGVESHWVGTDEQATICVCSVGLS